MPVGLPLPDFERSLRFAGPGSQEDFIQNSEISRQPQPYRPLENQRAARRQRDIKAPGTPERRESVNANGRALIKPDELSRLLEFLLN